MWFLRKAGCFGEELNFCAVDRPGFFDQPGSLLNSPGIFLSPLESP
jgi:hypothetical protein